MKRNIQIIVFAILTLLVLQFIFHNSAQTAEESGAISGSVAQILKSIVDPRDRIPYGTFEHGVRKLAHFTEFGMLGFCCMGLTDGVFRRGSRWRVLLPVLAVPVIAAADEASQFFSEGRGPGVLDVCIDSAGGFSGICLMAVLLILLRMAKGRRENKYI